MNAVLAVPTTDGDAQAATGSRRRSVFRRGETALARTVYGLILTLATVGELVHHEESAGASVMAIVALAGLDAQAALYTCFVVGLVAVRGVVVLRHLEPSPGGREC